MKLSQKQRIDLESIEYFVHDPSNITDDDRRDFLAFSDRGIIPEHRQGQLRLTKGHSSKQNIDLAFFTNKQLNGYQKLFLGKSRRGLHVQLWEDGIMDGVTPIVTLVENLPEAVMLFMEKSLFKGLYSRKGKNEVFKGRWYEAWTCSSTLST